MDTDPLGTPIGLASAAASSSASVGVVFGEGHDRAAEARLVRPAALRRRTRERDDTLRAACAAEPDLADGRRGDGTHRSGRRGSSLRSRSRSPSCRSSAPPAAASACSPRRRRGSSGSRCSWKRGHVVLGLPRRRAARRRDRRARVAVRVVAAQRSGPRSCSRSRSRRRRAVRLVRPALRGSGHRR